MLQKIFSTILTLLFISLVALFAYKTVRKPQVLTTSLYNNSAGTIEVSGNSLSQESLNAAIKEYIINNPEDLVTSLEGMQKKKVLESARQASGYLEKNRVTIEQADSPPVLGNRDGDVSIVVFYDYNCSFSKKANEYTNEIIASDPGVKVILRPIPILGGTSMYAAKAALAIQKISQEKFPVIHNNMMKMQIINEDSVKELVSKYDIDYTLVDNEVNSYSIKQSITKNFELAKGLGIQGAPSYIINGNFVPGLIPVEKFKTIILQLRSTLTAVDPADDNAKH